jgi:hypothetical protein
MPWKKLVVCTTGQIAEALRQKLEFALEERAEVSLDELRVAQLVSVALRGVAAGSLRSRCWRCWDEPKQGFDIV